MIVVGCLLCVVFSWLFAVCCLSVAAISCMLLFFFCRSLFDVCCLLCVDCRQVFVVICLLFVVCCFAVGCPLFGLLLAGCVGCLLFVGCCSLFVVRCLLLVERCS